MTDATSLHRDHISPNSPENKPVNHGQDAAQSSQLNVFSCLNTPWLRISSPANMNHCSFSKVNQTLLITLLRIQPCILWRQHLHEIDFGSRSAIFLMWLKHMLLRQHLQVGNWVSKWPFVCLASMVASFTQSRCCPLCLACSPNTMQSWLSG